MPIKDAKSYEIIAKFWGFSDYQNDLQYIQTISGYNSFSELVSDLTNQDLNADELFFPTCCLYGEIVAEYSDLSQKEILGLIKNEYEMLNVK